MILFKIVTQPILSCMQVLIYEVFSSACFLEYDTNLQLEIKNSGPLA